MLKEYKGDYRIMRVVMSSNDPIQTLHKINNNEYSIITFLDMLEMLDVQATLKENEVYKQKIKQKREKGRK
jgi:hypothetical protein